MRNFTPVAASRSNSVFSTAPGVAKLFRVDFGKGDAFDPDWVSVSKKQVDAGLWTATSKWLQKGATWVVDSGETKTAFNRAMLGRATTCSPSRPKAIWSCAARRMAASWPN